MRALWLFVLLLAARLDAGAWSLDVGLAAAVGGGSFVAEPAGQDPAAFFGNPKVSAYTRGGLIGSGGVDLSLQRKRRFGLDLQVLWEGRNLVMDEVLDFGSVTLARQTLWEWQSVTLPLQASYAWPLWSQPKQALLLRTGLGAYASFVQGRRKTLSSGVGAPLERPWAGPAQDVGPLLALGLDWISLPGGRRTASFEVRAMRGTALQDPAAGAGLPVWGVQGMLTVPVWMRVL